MGAGYQNRSLKEAWVASRTTTIYFAHQDPHPFRACPLVAMGPLQLSPRLGLETLSIERSQLGNPNTQPRIHYPLPIDAVLVKHLRINIGELPLFGSPPQR